MPKKILTLLFIVFYSIASGKPPAKKPTIMVVPSDVWCFQHGFMIDFDNQGTKMKVPDYKRAFQENADLIVAINKINSMMAERDFPLKNMESAVKSLEYESAEDAIFTSKTGSGIAESPIEKIKKVAKADIIIQLTWNVDTTGPIKALSCVLQGLDSYTDKQVAGASASGQPSHSADLATLLEEAIVGQIDEFNASLQAHFDDMFKNGREIVIRIKKFDTWDGDLETEFQGVELATIIEDWVQKNTIQERYSLTDVNDNNMHFEQVRMPLFDASDHAIDARKFLKGLQKKLEAPPYNITNKLVMRGLGQATIILGER